MHDTVVIDRKMFMELERDEAKKDDLLRTIYEAFEAAWIDTPVGTDVSKRYASWMTEILKVCPHFSEIPASVLEEADYGFEKIVSVPLEEKMKASNPAMANSLMTINPYCEGLVWAFDDPATGVVREALVAGMPEMIRAWLDLKEIPQADGEKGFTIVFSSSPFPGYDFKMDLVGPEFAGNIYSWNGMQGWLCPALFLYFREAPSSIYAMVSPGPEVIRKPRPVIQHPQFGGSQEAGYGGYDKDFGDYGLDNYGRDFGYGGKYEV